MSHPSNGIGTILLNLPDSLHELAGQTPASLRDSASGLDLFQCLAAAGEFGHDGFDGGGPDKGRLPFAALDLLQGRVIGDFTNVAGIRSP
jgi:hypothetical protein